MQLRRTPAGWKAYALRWWPVERRQGTERTVYDAATWQRLDAEADRRKAGDNLRAGAEALQAAYRHAEGYELTRRLTAKKSASPDDWVLRAQLAFELGKLDDVVVSLKRARSLNRDVRVPYPLAAALAPPGKR
jgi:hypothetical protein